MFSDNSYTELCQKIIYVLQNIFVLSGLNSQFIQNRLFKYPVKYYGFYFNIR